MDCTRRDLLRYAGTAALASMLPRGLWADTPSVRTPAARSLIQIWMWGGPAHLDTFDPKPEAGRDYCGPYDSPIATTVDGLRIGERLPLLAGLAHRYSVIRSLTHGINGHETASYLMQTGHQPGRLVFPSLGAVVSRFKGYDAGYQGEVPPYVVLTQPQGRFSEAGLLGQAYRPFCTGGNPARNPFAVEGIVVEGVSDERQRRRQNLLKDLDTLGRRLPGHPGFVAFDHAQSEAYDLMFGRVREVFDLGREDEATREAYGRSTFGQSCLAARRLVEAGVPYITINYRGWDTHKNHFQSMERMLPELDRGLATLLRDLEERDLFDRTILWWGGEFGRTPRIQWEAPWNGGRGHFGQCFSALVAGGGFLPGQVIGASDARGETVRERPVSPRNLMAAFLERLGIDPEGQLPNERGLDLSILPPAAEDTLGGGRLHEILPS